MAYPILGTPSPQFIDSSGAPYASGTITTLDPADDSVKASYPTADDADAGTNGTSGDITLDASGRPTSTQYWGKDGEDYKVVIKDSSGSTILTMDDVKMPLTSRRSVNTFAQSDGTPSIADGNIFLTYNGNETITNFDDGQAGDIIQVHSDAESGTATYITNAAGLQLRNNLDFRMIDRDTLTLATVNGSTWAEVGRSEYNKTMALTGATTLTEGDTGRHYLLNAAGGFAVTLPAVAEGITFDFSVMTAPTTAYTVVTPGGANLIYGSIFEADGTAAAASAEDTITFVASTSLIGDWVSLVCDGTNWHMKAFTSAGGGITVTAT